MRVSHVLVIDEQSFISEDCTGRLSSHTSFRSRGKYKIFPFRGHEYEALREV